MIQATKTKKSPQREINEVRNYGDGTRSHQTIRDNAAGRGDRDVSPTLPIEMTEEISSPLFEVSWDQDRQFRMDPATVSALLREQVPVLDFVKWAVTSIEPGSAESVLPLNPQSTNQHFTHQAALCVLAGDYTGGIALASLLSGWPVIGVHPVSSPQSVSMWLLRVEIKYMRPSVTDCTVTARIDPERHDRIRKRFLRGQAVVEAISIEFHNGDSLIAEATLTYFARQSEKLRSEGISTTQINSLYSLKLTSSAELIAGVRASENGRLFQDPFAAQMAGQHGVAMANRFCERTPQLGGMVAARTSHLDGALSKFLAAGGRDVVLLGVGWDMRPFRLSLPAGTRVYELDFPTTLAERNRRLSQLTLTDPQGVTRSSIPIDVRTMSLTSVLEDILPHGAPVFIAWEGMSMYFSEKEVRQILDGMLPVLRDPDSRLWIDLIDRQVVEHPEQLPSSVQNFVRGMQILGDPLTFGPSSVADFMCSVGLRSLEVTLSDVCFPEGTDAVYSSYKFCVASALTSTETAVPSTVLES